MELQKLVHRQSHLKDAYIVRNERFQAMRSERERLFEENETLKQRVKNAPMVREAIERLSKLGQGRALAQFETMLGAAIVDVMEEDSKKIRLELDSSSRGYGSSELNVFVERPSGLEMLEYNGGSFNNVFSLAARVFATVRSKKLRNFMALDEADCHIRGPRKGEFEGDAPSTSRRFYNALYCLSRQTGIQSMAITHHDTDLFKEIGAENSAVEGQPDINILRVIRNEQSGNYITEMTGEPKWSDESVVGIRSITLENIANYHKATFHLSPGVNIITGAHDIGKSQVINAMRLMFYRSGQGGSRLAAHIVRHGQKTGVVRVRIENGLEIVLTIKKSVTKSKVGRPSIKGDLSWEIYDHKNLDKDGKPTLYDYNGTPCSGGLGNNVPDWVGDVSGIQLSQVEEGNWNNTIAVQLAEQSNPGFLTAGTKPRDRAHILSIGQSVDVPRRMKETNEREILEAQRTLRKNENTIRELGSKIAVMEPLIKKMQEDLEKSTKALEDILNVDALAEKILLIPSSIEKKIAQLKHIDRNLIILGDLPKHLERIDGYDRLVDHGRRLSGDAKAFRKSALVMEAVKDIPDQLSHEKRIEIADNALSSVASKVSRFKASVKSLAVLDSVPKQLEISAHGDKLSNYVGSIASSVSQYRKLSLESVVFENLPKAVVYDDKSSLIVKSGKTLSVHLDNFRNICSKEIEIKKAQEDADRDYDNIVDELKLCPVCHNELAHKGHQHG